MPRGDSTRCSTLFFSSRRRHTRSKRDWSSDVCSSDLLVMQIWDPKRYAWSGAALPGGHIEPHESLVESVIREIKEETGLTIKHRSEERRVGKECRNRWAADQ